MKPVTIRHYDRETDTYSYEVRASKDDNTVIGYIYKRTPPAYVPSAGSWRAVVVPAVGQPKRHSSYHRTLAQAIERIEGVAAGTRV